MERSELEAEEIEQQVTTLEEMLAGTKLHRSGIGDAGNQHLPASLASH